MPWKVAPMSEIRLAFVHHVRSLNHSVAEACRRFGISRKTGYKWLFFGLNCKQMTYLHPRPQTTLHSLHLF